MVIPVNDKYIDTAVFVEHAIIIIITIAIAKSIIIVIISNSASIIVVIRFDDRDVTAEWKFR